MNNTALRIFLGFFLSVSAFAADAQPEDENHPVPPMPVTVPATPSGGGFSSLFTDASLTLNTAYYGRARSADNRGRFNSDGSPVPHGDKEIHVNVFGQRADLRSGYAWGVIGFDLAGQTNLGRGRGWSEVLLHKEPGDRDKSFAALSQAALKTRFAMGDVRLETRAGYTTIDIGSLGNSGGLFPHSYRGVESKLIYKNFTLGYGWADRFRNEWDNTYRKMYNSWHQNRWGNDDGRRVTYVHSLGARYVFGKDNAGFVDLGVGEGKDYRRNAQLMVSIPVDLGCFGALTLRGYGHVAKYRELFGQGKKHTEYHVSGSAELKTGLWTFMTGVGHTRAPDSGEMNFRLTAWANSDNRNFIQTWGQLDDFVWDGQSVAKAGVKYELGEKIGLPGLSVGASGIYSWNAKNGQGRSRISGWEADYNVQYAVREGRLKGLAMGVYAGHLRWSGNNFHGKQNRNDVKVVITYSRALEGFLRCLGK